MTPIYSPVTTIRQATPAANQPLNSLDTAIHNCGRKLLGLQMTRLHGEPTKGDAQSIVRDALDVAKIVDDALLEIGREVKAYFGSHIELTLWTDQLSDAITGNLTFNVCEAIEVREEEFGAEIDPDYRYKSRRNAA